LFLCSLPHGLRVIAVRMCYVAVFIEGAPLHRRDYNRNAAARTRACDKFFERSFVGRESACAPALLLLVVVPVLYEQVIAGLHKAENFVQTFSAERAAKGFARLRVIRNRHAGLEEAREHLSPTVVRLARL